MKAITVGVLYKRKRLISWGAVVVQRQAGLVGSFCSSFWVVLRKVMGQLVLGAGGVAVLQHLSGTSNMLPLIFGFTVSGPWLPPVIHFTWENEEEKCRIRKHVQSPFLEIP